MKIFLISAALYFGVGALLIFFYALYSGKAIKRLLLNALLGLSAVAVINLTSRFSGVYININPITVSGIAVFSVPAVIGFLLLNIIL